MYVIISIILIMLFIIIMFFAVMLKVVFTIDTDSENMNLTMHWLYPFFTAKIVLEGKPVLIIYLFKKRIYKKELKPQKRQREQITKVVKPEEINVNAFYGFRDPFITGVACGAVSAISQFVKIKSFNNVPDFMAESDYIYFNATAKINIGRTLLNMLKARKDK